MKKLLLIPLAVATICLQAQHLIVQPIQGEPSGFSIIKNPKITFDNGTMNINGTPFAVNEIQKLTFGQWQPTNIVAVNSDNNIFVFPNPVNDELSIVVENPQGLNFRLFDMSGRLLKSDQIHSTTTIINVQNFPVGTYILHLDRNGEHVQTLQIIKN